MDNDDVIDESQIDSTASLTGNMNESVSKPPLPRLSRKRTKTGCLTCRRRRIKCGEERPICGNCIKSKRQCEGYNQRVIFKDPLGTQRGQASSASTNPPLSATTPATSTQTITQYNLFHNVHHSPTAPSNGIAPRRNSTSQEYISANTVTIDSFSEFSGQTKRQPPEEALHKDNPIHQLLTSDAPRDSQPSNSVHGTVDASGLTKGQSIPDYEAFSKPQASYSSHNVIKHNYNLVEDRPHVPYPPEWSNDLSCASEPPLQEIVYRSDIREVASTLLTQSYQESTDQAIYEAWNNQSGSRDVLPLQQQAPLSSSSRGLHAPPFLGVGDTSLGDVSQDIKLRNEEATDAGNQLYPLQGWSLQEQMQPIITKEKNAVLRPRNDKVILGDAHESYQHILPDFEDDETIYKSDDNMDIEEYDHDPDADFGNAQYNHLRNNDLGIVVALQATQDRQEQVLRTYHSFLDGPSMLATYQPTSQNSPLRDSTTARIFVHYINVTGPSISLFERHPANPSLIFQGRPVPKSQQHIWAYTMPILALSNQALLHTMLAIGSLHMALLQDGPITASLKHYHIAIRQVAKSVALPMRRGQPATLAATLLLGWYELMSADHQKWSSHLLGATHLLAEIDFAGMTKYLKNRKMEQQQTRHSNLYHHQMALGIVDNVYEGQAQTEEILQQGDVNEDLVGMIMGKNIRYDRYGQILEDSAAFVGQQKIYTQRELEIYENQRDLFWWFCKQDAFQSIISGNSLFMKYDLWSHCPPRAAIGRRDATYGTYDHLILLLGRLAEFAAKDLKRKRKIVRLNGGQWRPTPGMAGQPTPAAQNAATQSKAPQIPSFAGMIPGTEGKTTLPRGFVPVREESPVTEGDERNLDDLTREAEDEWLEIRTAFSILEENYGPDFLPLGPEHSHPIQTPFGPALQYRTYSITGIWVGHYMGLILCHRYHPSMPPAATIAAGVAARQTAFYANEIGRISAAIAPNASAMTQVSTGVGSGLMESTFGLFVAGVQYQDPVQRCWLVQRCFDTKRLTGWQTAEAIAIGCESSWVKAAEVGRGPPYNRVVEKKLDQKVWYTARRSTNGESTERNDRNRLIVARTNRVHHAVGLVGLGFEEDFENLDFEGDDAKGNGD